MVEFYNGIKIEFEEEVVQVLDVLSVLDRDVEVLGYDKYGNEYSAVANESCGEIVEIDTDNIEPTTDLWDDA